MAKYDGHELEIRGIKIPMEPGEAMGLVHAIQQWEQDDHDQKQKIVEPEEEWTVGYMRYGHPQDWDASSLNEALDFLIDGANNGELSFSLSGYILTPDNKTIKGEELIEMVDTRERERAN